MRRATWAAALSMLLGGAAQAAGDGGAAGRVLAPLSACRAIADSTARAGCYDRALDGLQRAIAANEVVVQDRAQRHEQRASMFGFGAGERAPPPVEQRMPKADRAAAKAEEINTVESTVVSATRYDYDQWTIRIATGAVWRTMDGGIGLPPHPGQRVTIKRGFMGSYSLKLERELAVKAIRVG